MINIIEHRPFFTSLYTMVITTPSNLIENIESLDASGVSISNAGGYHSTVYNYPQDFMKPVIDDILQLLVPIYEKYGIDKKPTLDNYWFNINKKYNYNMLHNHAGSFFSACLYVKVPNNSGNIVFERPDVLNDYIDADRYTEYNYGSFSVPAKENELVIFPSHLKHLVQQNLTNDIDDRRISIAFNFR